MNNQLTAEGNTFSPPPDPLVYSSTTYVVFVFSNWLHNNLKKLKVTELDIHSMQFKLLQTGGLGDMEYPESYKIDVLSGF